MIINSPTNLDRTISLSTLGIHDIHNIAEDATAAGEPNPGIFSLISFPYTLFSNIYACIRSTQNGDSEEQRDAILRLSSMPLYALQSLIASVTTICQISAWSQGLPMASTPFIPPFITGTLGIGLCAIEALIEGQGALNASDLLYKLEKMKNSDDESLIGRTKTFCAEHVFLGDDEQREIRAAAKRAFSELDEEDEGLQQEIIRNSKAAWTTKYLGLARRVAPWCAQEVYEKLLPLTDGKTALERMESEDQDERAEAIAEIRELVGKMEEQTKKKLIVHAVGLAAIFLMATGFIVMLAAPPLIPCVILTVAGLLSTARYLLQVGFWNNKGWTFSPYLCIPLQVRNYIEHCFPSLQPT